MTSKTFFLNSFLDFFKKPKRDKNTSISRCKKKLKNSTWLEKILKKSHLCICQKQNKYFEISFKKIQIEKIKKKIQVYSSLK